ncbi:uncharacterized protein DMENIID0001_064010 [Sergentomyia squamirostris]
MKRNVLNREKRFLVYPYGGLTKAVLGFSCPIVFGDNSKRSLLVAYNFQAQYQFPQNATSPLRAPFFTGLQRGRRHPQESVSNKASKDDSRKLLYSFLKLTLDRRGIDGEQCLLRAICEVAQTSFTHNGLFGELIDLIFTPQVDESGPEYNEARTIGLRGGNCQATFGKCAPGQGFLDSITVTM